jgi:acyl-CoA synthetase (AMP-forming)/AMP-acid ligase II
MALPAEERDRIRLKQGRSIFGVEMKIVDDDGANCRTTARPSATCWCADRGSPAAISAARRNALRDGWFPTGDVATIDPDGYMQITDRSKDVIKSGGEWISSIDLENIAVAHPAVTEAAVIGAAHPKWDERPLLVVVRKAGQVVTREELIAFYEGKVAKWWMPDDVIFVDDLPHTATGKLSKLQLRDRLRDYRFPGA